MVTKVFLSSNAIWTHAVHVIQPGNAYAGSFGKPARILPSFLDNAHDLMSRNHRRFARRQFAFNNMQIRAANAAAAHAYQNLTGGRFRLLDIGKLEGIRFDGSGMLEQAGFHGSYAA